MDDSMDPYYEVRKLLIKKGEIGFNINKYFPEAITTKPCVKCGVNNWISFSAQTRSADEGETSLMRCTGCNLIKKSF
jgi:DNA-directed RNA polymerase subunit M/transcription elongation factor TFIIS